MGASLGEQDSLLSEKELMRASSIRDEAARRRWIASRGLLRELLGQWLDVDPRGLEFEAGRYGKPRLALAGPTFNVSHSGLLAVYAICADREVGVDVEASDRRAHRRDDVAVARRVLGEAVAERLSALTGQARSDAFLRAWVRHEAIVKCLGTGIGHAERARGETPWVTELDVGQDAFAALAVQGGEAEVIRHDANGQ